jgi:response regulator RpfG family c-di-GMP phosphodiesterase
MMIADKINEATEGHFKDICLSENEIEELRLTAWMHDTGKITTPEYVVDKQTKLETIFDRINLVDTRFNLIIKSAENKCLNRKIELLIKQKGDVSGIDRLDNELAGELEILREERVFIQSCNEAGEFMSDDRIERVKEIAGKTYSLNGEEEYYLSDDEVHNLCIRKGSLTDAERNIINNHAKMTQEILEQLPFPNRLTNVPVFAGGHHEKLDGTGYPNGLSAEDLPLQARILAIADVFEALTAKDRPYKKPMNLTQAVRIMGFMKKDKHIDPDIYDLFIEKRIYYDYAIKEMNPEQIDES